MVRSLCSYLTALTVLTGDEGRGRVLHNAAFFVVEPYHQHMQHRVTHDDD